MSTYSYEELKQARELAESVGLNVSDSRPAKRNSGYVNAFDMSSDKLIYFYPFNDGYPTLGFEFYYDGKFVLGNDTEYREITNLDDILLEMVRAYRQALDNRVVIDPFSFLLQLTDRVNGFYRGRANLVAGEEAILNPILKEEEIDDIMKEYVNRFLDCFIGWNFGVAVNGNEELRNELNSLNNKVIDMGIRESAGPGYEVVGSPHEVIHGVQHYELPTERLKGKKKNIPEAKKTDQS